MNKKGDLALSVNAIVIVVISFVVLGLALTLTRNIFKFAGEKAASVIPLTDLETQPTPENPISINEEIPLSKGGELAQSIGFYNTKSDSVARARFDITDCLYTDPTTGTQKSQKDVNPDKLPLVISTNKNVGASEKAAYKIIINERGMTSGLRYICDLVVRDSSDKTKIYETKQIFIRVVA